jgi:hypothetical protein
MSQPICPRCYPSFVEPDVESLTEHDDLVDVACICATGYVQACVCAHRRQLTFHRPTLVIDPSASARHINPLLVRASGKVVVARRSKKPVYYFWDGMPLQGTLIENVWAAIEAERQQHGYVQWRKAIVEGRETGLRLVCVSGFGGKDAAYPSSSLGLCKYDVMLFAGDKCDPSFRAFATKTCTVIDLGEGETGASHLVAE